MLTYTLLGRICSLQYSTYSQAQHRSRQQLCSASCLGRFIAGYALRLPNSDSLLQILHSYEYFAPTKTLRCTLASTRGQLRRSGWKNGQLRVSLVPRLTSKGKFSLRLYYLTSHRFEPTTSITECFYNRSKGRGLTISLKAANGLFLTQKLSDRQLQNEFSSKLPDINRPIATN